MRDGTVPLPDCRTEVQEIIIEAKFYLIQVSSLLGFLFSCLFFKYLGF